VICVEKFLGESDAQAQLAEFQAIGSAYRQRQFIEEGGWAVMPNMDEAARQSADLCAKVLAALEPEAPTPSTTTAAEEPVAVVQ
jgi:hypothetical protein